MGVNKEALTRFAVLASIVDWYGVTFEDTEAWTIKHLDEFCAVWDHMTQKCTLSYDVDGRRWSVTREKDALAYDGITEDDFVLIVMEPWEAVSTIRADDKDEELIIKGHTYGLPQLMKLGKGRPSISMYADKATAVVVYRGWDVTKVFVADSYVQVEKIIKHHIGQIIGAALDKIEN